MPASSVRYSLIVAAHCAKRPTEAAPIRREPGRRPKARAMSTAQDNPKPSCTHMLFCDQQVGHPTRLVLARARRRAVQPYRGWTGRMPPGHGTPEPPAPSRNRQALTDPTTPPPRLGSNPGDMVLNDRC